MCASALVAFSLSLSSLLFFWPFFFRRCTVTPISLSLLLPFHISVASWFGFVSSRDSVYVPLPSLLFTFSPPSFFDLYFAVPFVLFLPPPLALRCVPEFPFLLLSPSFALCFLMLATFPTFYCPLLCVLLWWLLLGPALFSLTPSSSFTLFTPRSLFKRRSPQSGVFIAFSVISSMLRGKKRRKNGKSTSSLAWTLSLSSPPLPLTLYRFTFLYRYWY